MFPIFRATELAHHLCTTVEQLREVLRYPDPYYEELILLDPKKPDRQRTVLSVSDPLRSLQRAFYENVLLNSLQPSDYSHGGRREHSIVSNANAHLASSFVYKTDISNFYPGIHDKKVYRLFHEHFGCSPDVASLCCRLCTHRHHLALGLATSPIIADQLLRTVDARIGAACRKNNWVYTRFVDDITISGHHDLSRAGIRSLIDRVLEDHGFKVKKTKSEAGRNGDVVLTGVRVVHGHLDVAKEYAAEVDRQLADAHSLSQDGPFKGPFYTFEQLAGRVQFICWVNPRRTKSLMGRFHKISAKKLMLHAKERQLVESKKKLVRTASVETNAIG